MNMNCVRLEKVAPREKDDGIQDTGHVHTNYFSQ